MECPSMPGFPTTYGRKFTLALAQCRAQGGQGRWHANCSILATGTILAPPAFCHSGPPTPSLLAMIYTHDDGVSLVEDITNAQAAMA